MNIRKKSLSYVIPIITIVSVLITATPCYAAETQYLDGYKGIIFEGENVCSVYVDSSSGKTIGIPHQYYWFDTGYTDSYDLYCSRCGASFGRGIRNKDGYYYIHDFDNINGSLRHFVFDAEGNKQETEACSADHFSAGNETHDCICKCGVSLYEEEHMIVEEIEKASVKENGFYATFCEICEEQLSGRVIYRPKTFVLSKTKTAKYNGKKVPKLTIKSSTGKVIASKYYKVKNVSGSKKSKKFKYKISFQGEYKGSKTITFIYKNGKWVTS